MNKVFLLIGLLFSVFWFVMRWYRLQKALQWWYRQHILRLFDEAEAARNGILQDAFTLRRTLELSLVQNRAIAGSEGEALLNTLGELHDSLKRFSDFLSPPYLEDSFPLAIDHLLKSYQKQHPSIALELSTPQKWQPVPYEQSRLVWITIDELLRITIAQSCSVRSISACLTQQATAHELVIEIVYSSPDLQDFQDELRKLSYLKRSAQFLTGGTCAYHQKGEALIWSMGWS